MTEADREYLLELAWLLDDAERLGSASDEPEGARFIRISDTLAVDIAARLREIVEVEDTPDFGPYFKSHERREEP